jgi:hypothetical protein
MNTNLYDPTAAEDKIFEDMKMSMQNTAVMETIRANELSMTQKLLAKADAQKEKWDRSNTNVTSEHLKPILYGLTTLCIVTGVVMFLMGMSKNTPPIQATKIIPAYHISKSGTTLPNAVKIRKAKRRAIRLASSKIRANNNIKIEKLKIERANKELEKKLSMHNNISMSRKMNEINRLERLIEERRGMTAERLRKSRESARILAAKPKIRPPATWLPPVTVLSLTVAPEPNADTVELIDPYTMTEADMVPGVTVNEDVPLKSKFN